MPLKPEDLPVVDRIVRVLGICACGTGIGDSRERQSRHFNTSIFFLLELPIAVAALQDRPNRLR